MGGVQRVTVVVKATFGFVHDGIARLVPPRDLVRADRGHDGVLDQAAETAPHLPGAGVILEGHAHAPGGRPAPSVAVRLAVVPGRGEGALAGRSRWGRPPDRDAARPSRARAALDKTLHVLGDRSPEGAPQPFLKLPLGWQRAYGGPGCDDNPAGTGAGSATGTPPNIVDPTGALRPAGFGPIPRAWAPRRRWLGGIDPALLGPAAIDLPEGLDFRFFHAAPADQQLDALRGDEWIVLDGLHPAAARVRTRLPGVRAEARWCEPSGPPRAVELGLDTLVIDADAQVFSLVWRGAIVPHHAPESGRIEARLTKGLAVVERRQAEAEPASETGHETVHTQQLRAVPIPRAVLPFRIEVGIAAKVEPEPEPAPDGMARTMQLRAVPVLRAVLPFRPVDAPHVPMGEVPKPPSQPGAGHDVAPPVLVAMAAVVPEPAVTMGPQEAPNPEPAEPAPMGEAPKPPAQPAVTLGPQAAPNPELAEPALAAGAGAPLDALVQEVASTSVSAPSPGAVLREKVRAALAAREGLRGLDLDKADLRGVDFSGAALANCRLRGADLRGCVLTEARLAGADLAGADLTGAVLTGADLTGADLSRATLVDASFAGAALGRANFSSARGPGASFAGATGRGPSFARGVWDGAGFERLDTTGADFTGASLVAARFDGATLVEVCLDDVQAEGASFEGARLPGAHAEMAVLVRASLRGVEAPGSVWERAMLDEAVFAGANLEGAQLGRASCIGTSFAGARAKDANLARLVGDRADLRRTGLEGADLRGARFHDASFEGADLRRVLGQKVDLSRAELTGADLGGANLRAAKLTAARLVDAVLEAADLRDADLEGADLTRASRRTAKLQGAKLKGVIGGGEG